MPELPQMRALSERLDEIIGGSRLEGSTTIQFSAAKTYEPSLDSLNGRVLRAVRWRAKYLVFDFGVATVLLHLSQGGRVELEPSPTATRPKNGVVRLVFEGRPGIFVREYGTQRKAGYWVLVEGNEGPLAKLGPEWGTPQFDEVLAGTDDRRRIHTFLRDQRTISGIGRGYADDILHRARISPYAVPAKLTGEERERLRAAATAVLSEALASERKREGGLPPKLSDGFGIHGRHGHECPRCAAAMKRVSFESYEITYCPDCQTGGKVLADRRLSRLIK